MRALLLAHERLVERPSRGRPRRRRRPATRGAQPRAPGAVLAIRSVATSGPRSTTVIAARRSDGRRRVAAGHVEIRVQARPFRTNWLAGGRTASGARVAGPRIDLNRTRPLSSDVARRHDRRCPVDRPTRIRGARRRPHRSGSAPRAGTCTQHGQAAVGRAAATGAAGRRVDDAVAPAGRGGGSDHDGRALPRQRVDDVDGWPPAPAAPDACRLCAESAPATACRPRARTRACTPTGRRRPGGRAG